MHPTPTLNAAEATIEGTIEPLVERAKDEDPPAVDDLLARMRPLVYRWAWLRTADTDDADDVTQAVLIRLHQRLTSFEGRSSITTWLYRVTANAAAELHRRRSTRERLNVRWFGRGETRTHDDDVVDRIENQRAATVISVMMKELTVQQRTALDLVDMQGYEPVEAARMLDMNPATLRVHLLRARRAVRKRLVAQLTRE